MDCCRRTPHAAVEIPPTGTVGWMGSMSAPYVCSVFESIGLRKTLVSCSYGVNHKMRDKFVPLCRRFPSAGDGARLPPIPYYGGRVRVLGGGEAGASG